MSTLQGSWIWYDLMSPDPEGSKAFYEAVVGWSISTGHGADTNYGFITNPDGGMTGGLMRLSAEMQQHGARPCWLGYIGVDDVDASVVAITAAGGKVLMAPFDIEMAGRVALVTDPGGATFYVMTPKPPPGGGASTAFTRFGSLGRCSWNELMAGAFDQDLEFYTSLFGWSLPEPMDMGELGKYQFVEHDGESLGAIMPKMPQVPAAMWSHYFRVKSIPAAQAAVAAAGGQVINGPMEVPGGEWIIQGIDPQGAMFALVGGK